MVELLEGVVFSLASYAILIIAKTLSKEKISKLKLDHDTEDKLRMLVFWSVISGICFGGMGVMIILSILFNI
jgi:hypothetical protein